MKVDLHVHTKYSDGNLSLDEVLALAANNSIKELAITDHDTIIRLKNYADLGKKYGLVLVPGIEIPTSIDGMHLLGYGITNFEKVEKELMRLKEYNEQQNIYTIEALQKIGIDISYEEIKKIAVDEAISYRDIIKYLAEKKYVENARDAYKKYIGEGQEAYYPSAALDKKEVIELIKDSGGIVSLAHPGTLPEWMNQEELIIDLIKDGLDGIEIYPPRLKDSEIKMCNMLAKKYDILTTIGTDFHDYQTDKLGVEVSEEFIDKFNEKVLRK